MGRTKRNSPLRSNRIKKRKVLNIKSNGNQSSQREHEPPCCNHPGYFNCSGYAGGSGMYVTNDECTGGAYIPPDACSSYGSSGWNLCVCDFFCDQPNPRHNYASPSPDEPGGAGDRDRSGR